MKKTSPDDIFSAAMEAEVSVRVLGDRRHGLDFAPVGSGASDDAPGEASGA